MSGYTVTDYGQMIADKKRMASYVKAVRDTLQVDDIVIDIGAGTGIFSFLACQFGAKHVYAIEPNKAIMLAEVLAAVNNLDDQITFFQDISTQVSLPETADLIISDLHGVLPLYKQHIQTIIDARTRLLKPQGTLIPQQDTLWVVPVEEPELYQKYSEPWLNSGYDLDMQAAYKIAANTWYRADFDVEGCLAEPQCWATLKYETIDTPNVVGEVACEITKEATAHGLAVWFDTTLIPGVQLSNAPGAPDLIYGSAFFPWPEPIKLIKGDLVRVKLAANLVGDEYVWRWESTIVDKDSGQTRVHFQQSTFFAGLAGPSQLKKRAANFVPELSRQGEIDQFVLSEMSRKTPLGHISETLCDRFPDQFSNYSEALKHVGKLSEHYSC